MDNTISIQRYTFNFLADTDIHLPNYSGSVLRGHFGNQLRRLVCFTKQPNCNACPLIERCSYGRLFETVPSSQTSYRQKYTNLPLPYVIEPFAYGTNHLPAGQLFSFSMLLIGDARQEFPLIIYVWEKVFTHGFKHREHIGHASLINVTLDDGSVVYDNSWEADERKVIAHTNSISLAENNTDINNLTIKLQTPLRIQSFVDNRSVIVDANGLNGENFCRALFRRCELLLGDIEVKLDDTLQMYNQNLHWVKTRRYSSKQQQEMEFFGLLGEFSLSGKSLNNIFPYLKIGEYLHVGKSATFGFGKFIIMEIN